MKIKIILLSLIIAFTGYSQTLDPTFGTNGGIIEKSLSTVPSYERLSGAKIQTDGKLVYTGRCQFNNLFVARTNIDGTLDLSFNGNGIKIIENINVVAALEIQSDGKILITGSNNVYRLNSNGSIDTAFSNNGFKALASGVYTANIYLQPDNKILLSGRIFDSTKFNFFITRLNQDGSTDSSFGNNGIINQSIGSEYSTATDMTLQTDGKILVTGYFKNGIIIGFTTIRYNSNGTIDATFGNLGIVQLVNTGQKIARSIGIQNDGKIVVVGTENSLLTVLRYNVYGSLDTSFDSDGIANTTIAMQTTTPTSNANDNKMQLKILSNGKLLISGTSQGDYALVQLNSNGSLDATFGSNGKTQVINPNDEKSCFLVVKPNGKIVTGGTSTTTGIINYTILTNNFSVNGIFESSTSFNAFQSFDIVKSILVQSSGKILVQSDAYSSGLYVSQIITRYNNNGSLDSSFGINGMIDNLLPDTKIHEQPDGKFLLSENSEIQRYSIDGILDTTFGNNGTTEFYLLNPNPINFIDNIIVSSDSKIFIAVDYYDGVNFSFSVVKLQPNGIIDTTFGVNGFATTRFNLFNTNDVEYPLEICINSLNEIIVSGYLRPNLQFQNNTAIGILKLNPNGTLNTSFGINGKYSIINNEFQYPIKMISLPNNQFILNNFKNSNGYKNTTTIKFNSNGTLDNSSGANGVVNDINFNNDMIVQNDGKILKTGSINNQISTTRFNSDGSIDTTFGNSGNLITNVNLESKSNSIYQTANNQFLLGGYTITNQNVMKCVIARYTNTTLGNLTFNNTNNQILIYPNPITDAAIFEYSLLSQENITIGIYDINGKFIKSIIENKNTAAGNQKQNIDLSNNMASGNYILKFSTNSGSQSIQIIKK